MGISAQHPGITSAPNFDAWVRKALPLGAIPWNIYPLRNDRARTSGAFESLVMTPVTPANADFFGSSQS